MFYWGGDDVNNWIANKGKVVGSGAFVQWVDNDRFLIVTAPVVSGQETQAIAEIALDANDKFSSVTNYRFDPEIWDLRVGATADNILVLYFASSTSSAPTLGRLRVEPMFATVDSVILDETWNPRGAVQSAIDGALIVIAKKPFDQFGGIYRLQSVAGVVSDSLLFEWDVSDSAARAVDLASDQKLYFLIYQGTGPNDIDLSLVVCFDLSSTTALPLVIAERPGEVDRVAVDPLDPNRLLLHRRSNGNTGEDVIELVDAATLQVTRLDVRTFSESCRVPHSHFADWKPDGKAIAFPAWSSDNSHVFPSSIWKKSM